MNEIGKLIITIVGVFSLVGSIVFYLGLMDAFVRVSQGDYNASQEIAESMADETVDTIKWTLAIEVLITIASVLGLGSVVALLKKL